MRFANFLVNLTAFTYLFFAPAVIAQQINQQVPNQAVQQKVPVQVAWSGWTDWSPCNATCGTGVSERIRQCFSSQNLPVANNFCLGHSREQRACSGGPPCPMQSRPVQR